ncbi:protein unc-50 homolog [Pollicipes pollicipes]|uniref:protein unc-50 homolog n=1 Tax=Pollicipes pollicipes TaxID=41117 RepID=UPI0018852810|nr:protein unc-50 homolog [Pollicipes pollicipes]
MKQPTSPPPTQPQSPYHFDSSVSPLPPPITHGASCLSAAAKRYKYLRRVIHFSQMDFEFALWQMLYLFIAPQKVYRDFHYRKQTKAQFARDDPAFLVLLSGWIIVSSACFALVLRLGVGGFLVFLLYVFTVDTLLIGAVIATALWLLSNRYLRHSPDTGQDVEWGFSFDVHLNAFFPSLIILHIVQILLYRAFLVQDGFLSHLVGNVLWTVAIGYYIYITFLGYSALPFLKNTRVFLYPLTLLALMFVAVTASGVNLSRTLMEFYRYRVLASSNWL